MKWVGDVLEKIAVHHAALSTAIILPESVVVWPQRKSFAAKFNNIKHNNTCRNSTIFALNDGSDVCTGMTSMASDIAGKMVKLPEGTYKKKTLVF